MLEVHNNDVKRLACEVHHFKTIPTAAAPAAGQNDFFTPAQVHRLGLTIIHHVPELAE
jgi:hypothetical protein